MASSASRAAAIVAFGAAAATFDERFSEWASVAAQRNAVRRHLLRAFPPGARLVELGGGTGEDALYLAHHGRRVLVTDGAAAMVERVRDKAASAGLSGRVDAEVLAIEDIEAFARDRLARGEQRFDGAFSNFAALNCVPDLRPVACALAELLQPGAAALLVIFGPLPPGEVVVQLLRGNPRAAFRRLRAGPVPARLGGVSFPVWYPRPGRAAKAFEPEFRHVATRGIGVFVPPSAAEPAISRRPRLLALLERLDHFAERPLARLGDHVLLHLERAGSAPAVRAPDCGPAPEDEVAGSGHRAPPAGDPAPMAASQRSLALRRFRSAYAAHREAEGRGRGGEAELLALPYLREGPQAAQWAVRSRTFDRFLGAVLEPMARAAWPSRPLHVLDLGAGNAWLSYRVMLAGHECTALDVRTDAVDGLGAVAGYRTHLPALPRRIAASFDGVPMADDVADLVVFNASIHYSLDLPLTLREAVRVLAPGGRVVILDSPFYSSAADGDAMVAEKRRDSETRYRSLTTDLTALPFIEYLTPAGLAQASSPLGLRWRRHRVRYPLRYELRPLIARVGGRRRPSRFDLWEGLLS
ncbi:MAG TPA: methyltransferase domain-containing protein [Longimicrobiales bacterium]|nr:methyltransferase domain-containing protein [Longimicrobiales bacterium]